MRKFLDFYPGDSETFRWQVVQAIRNYGAGVVLDANNFDSPIESLKTSSLNFIAGVGKVDECINDFDAIKHFHQEKKDWMLGFFSYDLKNKFEYLQSNNPDGIEMPQVCFIQPQYLILEREDKWEIGYLPEYDNDDSCREFLSDLYEMHADPVLPGEVKLNARVSRCEYLETVDKVLWHIHRGDIYELNYCIEFFNQNVDVDPYSLYYKLRQLSPTPFSAFVKYHDKSLMCASPERYLKKTGDLLVSQPIKGTSPRDENAYLDKANIDYLRSSEKERSENIMITDLVRNDLSIIARRGSVKVDELCGIYSFKQVHQMISTISARLDERYAWLDAIRATFPMGSMTGAPKVRAMELIEKYEATKRGLYSGAVGYVTPEGDFDFNVVIRSMIYNQKRKYLSFMVGSAITSKADPEMEYEECLVKASAIMKVLKSEI